MTIFNIFDLSFDGKNHLFICIGQTVQLNTITDIFLVALGIGGSTFQ